MQLEFDLVADLSDHQAELVTGSRFQFADSAASANALSTAIASPFGFAISAGTVANSLSLAQNVGISTITSPSVQLPINIAVNLK
nr:hypothetical protein [Synechococcus elongatus]